MRTDREEWEIGRGQIRSVDVQPNDLDVTSFGDPWRTFVRSHRVTIRIELEIDP